MHAVHIPPTIVGVWNPPSLPPSLPVQEAEPWLWWFSLIQLNPDTQFASLQHKEACQVHREIQVQAIIQPAGPCLHYHQPEPSPCLHGQWRAGTQLHCLQPSEYQLYLHAWHVYECRWVIFEGMDWWRCGRSEALVLFFAASCRFIIGKCVCGWVVSWASDCFPKSMLGRGTLSWAV